MANKIFKVLIIDDAYFVRNLIKRAINTKPQCEYNYSFEVIGEAKTGKEGLENYLKTKPDIVTIDLNLPDISGIQVVRNILKIEPNVKIIAISSNENSGVKEDILKAGASFFILKPFQNAFIWEKLDIIANDLLNPSITEKMNEVIEETSPIEKDNDEIIIIEPKVGIEHSNNDKIDKNTNIISDFNVITKNTNDIITINNNEKNCKNSNTHGQQDNNSSNIPFIKDNSEGIVIIDLDDEEDTLFEASKKEENPIIYKESNNLKDNLEFDIDEEIQCIQISTDKNDLKNKVSDDIPNINNNYKSETIAQENADFTMDKTGVEHAKTHKKDINVEYPDYNDKNDSTNTNKEDKTQEISIIPPRDKILMDIHSDRMKKEYNIFFDESQLDEPNETKSFLSTLLDILSKIKNILKRKNN